MQRLAPRALVPAKRPPLRLARILQEALGLDDGDGEGGASDVGDLDDYLNALDAEVGGEGEEEKEKE
jgi:hypothetical protein